MPIMFWYHGSEFSVPLITNCWQQGSALVIMKLPKITIQKNWLWHPTRSILKKQLLHTCRHYIVLKIASREKNTWLQIANDRKINIFISFQKPFWRMKSPVFSLMVAWRFSPSPPLFPSLSYQRHGCPHLSWLCGVCPFQQQANEDKHEEVFGKQQQRI